MATCLPADRAVAGSRTSPLPWTWVAGLSTATAGALHLAAAIQSLSAGNLVVGFFLLVAVAQLGLAVALPMVSQNARATGRSGSTVGWSAAVILVTAGLVALYVLVHSSDLLAGLVGPDPTTAAAHGHSAAGPGHPIETAGPISLSGAEQSAGRPVTALGTSTVAVELLSIAAAAALLPGAWRRRTTNLLAVVGGLAWALWLTGVLG